MEIVCQCGLCWLNTIRIECSQISNTMDKLQKEVYLVMSNLTEKELSALGDLLSFEELLVKKYNNLAETATDQEIKRKLQGIAQKHQEHFNKLYSQL